MSQSMLIASPLLLLVLVSILLPTHGRDIGEGCNIDNSREQGICKLLRDCSVVYQQLLGGKMPQNICGFSGFDPIVCCPTEVRATTKPPQSTEIIQTEMVRPLKLNGRGSLARAKCAEAAEAVYGLELPPIPIPHRKPVNVSRCALKSRKLIVGGVKADPKEFPHMAAVGFTDPGSQNIAWNCGGSLISAKIVLTAAHCTWNPNWGNATWVRVGDLNLAQTNDDAMPQNIKIAERIKHPEYKGLSVYNDIAILRLEKEATYNAWVRPACLPIDLPDIGTDNKAVASGWGLVDWSDDTGSDNLLKVTLKLVNHTTCNSSISDGSTSAQLPLGIVDESQICAGEEGKDTCQGDSGGPLAIFNKDHDCMYNIIGITSVGRLCGSFIPGVYTRVYNYIPWIERAAWPEYFLNN
ncbi:Serine protease snake [Camponotus floridanus]|uniref:Serine protease snake n=1 Tax=Camponotus floridanus TaxID=104421 RepID=E2A4P5_CAMFO|nr:serine protease persephone [Camponotus floridanus]EFN71579.1 Serine protease snake [Camponotus floridanus]